MIDQTLRRALAILCCGSVYVVAVHSMLPATDVGTSLHHSATRQASVTEAWRVGRTAGQSFSTITGMLEAEPGSIWIADIGNRRIALLNRSGESAGVVIAPDDGIMLNPAPRWLVRHGDDIVSFDQISRNMLAFSLDGEIVRTVPLAAQIEWSKGLAILPDGSFVISAGIAGRDYALHRFSPTGRLLASWVPLQFVDSLPLLHDIRAAYIASGGALAADDQGGLIFSRAAPHEIIAYDMRHLEAGLPRNQSIVPILLVISDSTDAQTLSYPIAPLRKITRWPNS
jgi:hypothetical protein